MFTCRATVLALKWLNDAIVLFHVAAAAAAADDDDDEDVTSHSSDRPGVTSTKSRPSSPINRLNRTASLIGLYCQWQLLVAPTATGTTATPEI